MERLQAVVRVNALKDALEDRREAAKVLTCDKCCASCVRSP